MSDLNIDDVTAALARTQVSSTNGVSFQGKSLKLDTAEDAQEIIDAINNCARLEYLNLEGNTLGVEAAKAIAKALEKHPELKRALWKDMFTGRMKTEIPLALEHLGKGLVAAGAKLTELDLSDNAFGPIGVEGLAALLRSSSCYNLQELRLNNNGLGITGGKLLATALMDCYNNSKAEGNPLALRVFIAGRNRLENPGARALAEVFSKIGTLEEIAMPQNGIYHDGITALSNSFLLNKNLQVLNLNDNTVTVKGSRELARALPNLNSLRKVNLGDCLLKTKGAVCIADALVNNKNLEELVLGFNEIGAKGGLALAKAMHNKDNLQSLILAGNQFGEAGRKGIQSELENSGQLDKLGSLSEDESEESESENEAENDENSQSENEEEAEEVEKTPTIIQQIPIQSGDTFNDKYFVDLFLVNPTVKNFLAASNDRNSLLLKEAKSVDVEPDQFFNNFISIIMKVSSLSVSTEDNAGQLALECSDLLFKELFSCVHNSQQFSLLHNSLLVHLGLIKSEDKHFKLPWNLDGCMTALEAAVEKNYFPQPTRDTLKVFLRRTNLNDPNVSSARKKLYISLNK